LLPPQDVASTGGSDSGIDTLVDTDGNTSYIYSAPAIDGFVYLGPLETPAESRLPRLLTPIFYLSIFVVAGLWLRPLLKDLDYMTAAAQRFAADFREPLATAAETTRLTSLARHLDDMSNRLSGLIQGQKELIAALSHEMRTPLARIRFALAVIDSRNNEPLREQLAALNNDVQEIDQLIGTMLSYARLDHPDLRMNWQSVPLDAWLAETSGKWQQMPKEVTIRREGGSDDVWMDPHLMGLALSNLLSNAVRHADKRVRCSVRADGDMAKIVVEDDGEGIPVGEREIAFKAFTRLDGSRNRETGGCGLGLAIVSRIAALHGGGISVDVSDDLGGARFVLHWTSDH
jgi:signal transduction histidine kinase